MFGLDRRIEHPTVTALTNTDPMTQYVQGLVQKAFPRLQDSWSHHPLKLPDARVYQVGTFETKAWLLAREG
jgi:hypothetical protein